MIVQPVGKFFNQERREAKIMASPAEIRKGRAMLYQGTPHIVLEMQHVLRADGRDLYRPP